MILWNRNEQIPYPTSQVLFVPKLQPLLEEFPESRYLRMGLRNRYGILASAFDSRFIGNRFKLERNIRLGCGTVPHQGGLNLSAIFFIEQPAPHALSAPRPQAPRPLLPVYILQ